jgi:hypothetical protein
LEEGVSVSFELQHTRSRAESYSQKTYRYDFDLKGRMRHSFYSRLASENQTAFLEMGKDDTRRRWADLCAIAGLKWAGAELSDGGV